MSLRLLILISLCLNCFLLVNSRLDFTSENYTGWQTTDNGNIHYLDRHDVRCKENAVMSYWKMEKSGDQIRIRYFCLEGPAVLGDYTWRYTSCNSVNGNRKKSLNFLDRHFIYCQTGEAVGAWKMERCGDNIRFKFRCNQIKSTGSETSNNGPTTDAHKGELFEMSDNYVKSNDYYNQALKGWKMNVSYYTYWLQSYQKIWFTQWFINIRNLNDQNLINGTR